jgi:hypothetical protein
MEQFLIRHGAETSAGIAATIFIILLNLIEMNGEQTLIMFGACIVIGIMLTITFEIFTGRAPK